jgi:hypothetical protein
LLCLPQLHQLTKKLLIGFSSGGLLFALASHFEFFEQLLLFMLCQMVRCSEIPLYCVACDFPDFLLAGEGVLLVVEQLAERSHLMHTQRDWDLIIGS